MIPDFQSAMRPVLASVSDGSIQSVRGIRQAMYRHFEVSDDERTEILPSGRQRTIDNRLGWAITYLVQAGLLHRPKRAHVEITPLGLEALAQNPKRIGMKVLRQYPGYQEFQARTKEKTTAEQPMLDPGTPVAEDDVTPSDLVERAVATNRAVVEAEVLRACLAVDPGGFEVLVLRLLKAMGYGKTGSLERTRTSNDGGIDGIISQDPLGLDRIYVQAKRYSSEHAIDRPKIHEFAGALMSKQGDRGVYISTSRFTDGAVAEAERINSRIELIDGRRLARLLVAHGVGVQTEQTVSLVKLDEDFFEDLA